MDANKEREARERLVPVSIHAPVMDANSTTARATNANGFNPRARDGREPGGDTWYWRFEVSIHAPVMDANKRVSIGMLKRPFQSTRP